MLWSMYKESTLLSFLSQQGTLIHCSCLHTSQQNKRAERKHQHILDSVYAQLLSASCLENFGLRLLLHLFILSTIFLQNIFPFEQLYGTPPNYSIRTSCMLSSVAFLAMEHNINVFVAGILFPKDFVYLAMLPFRNILYSLVSRLFTSPSRVLICFLLNYMSNRHLSNSVNGKIESKN